jgi:hypothetical protein
MYHKIPVSVTYCEMVFLSKGKYCVNRRNYVNNAKLFWRPLEIEINITNLQTEIHLQ